MLAWRAGDQGAARALFDRYFDRLYRFFATKVSSGVKDLIQETLVACIEGKDAIRDPAAFHRYLFGVARRRLYRRWRDEGGIDFTTSSVADLCPSPSSLLVEDEQQRIVLEAMRRIPVDLQVALELFYWEEMPASAIAEVLEIPEGTVRTRLRRARELVGKELAKLARVPFDRERVEALTRSIAAVPVEDREDG